MPNIQLPLNEIPIETPFRVKTGGVAIVVIRSNGRISAYEDVCPHASWPLSQGEVSNGVLECPGHGWEFSVESGQCLNAPAYCLKSVPVVTDGDFVHFQCENLAAGNGRRESQGACESSLS
jgi:nitrite reductase/ring-hydroxylating ferredoxin subunit